MQTIQNHSDLVTRKCFICEKQLVGAINSPDEIRHEFKEPPSDAIVFHTYGNFGSTKLDGLDFEGKYLEITICDECYATREHLCIMKENEFNSLPKLNLDELEKHI